MVYRSECRRHIAKKLDESVVPPYFNAAVGSDGLISNSVVNHGVRMEVKQGESAKEAKDCSHHFPYPRGAKSFKAHMIVGKEGKPRRAEDAENEEAAALLAKFTEDQLAEENDKRFPDLREKDAYTLSKVPILKPSRSRWV